MEGVFAAASCVLTAVAAFHASIAACAPRPRARKLGDHRVLLRDRAIETFEALGHRVWVIRIANNARMALRMRRLQAALASRGIVLTVFGCTAASIVGVASSMLAGVVASGSVLGAPVCGALAVFSAAAGVGRFEGRERDRAANQMPEVLRSFSTSIGAGRSLSQAVEYAGKNLPAPIGPEFLQASFEIAGGRPAEKAIEDVCARVRAPGMELLATALSISRKTGSPLGELFGRTAQMVADTVAMRRELQVKTSQARLSAKVVACMPVILAGVLTLVSDDYRAGLASGAGRACVCVAALLDGIALLAIRSLMRGGTR